MEKGESITTEYLEYYLWRLHIKLLKLEKKNKKWTIDKDSFRKENIRTV